MFFSSLRQNNSNKQKIILHIGPHKTASTYIQQSLYQNAKILNDADVVYPQLGLDGYGHHKLAHLLFKKEYVSAEEIIKQILNIQSNTIIISSEDFDKLDVEDIEKLQELLSDCLVNVVYVKRSICEVMISHWQEMIKHGNTYTWSEYFFQNMNKPFKSQIINNCKVLDLYKDAFGGNIDIINYDSIQDAGGDIMVEFLKIVDVEIVKRYKIKKDHYVNKSMGYDDIEIIRILNYMHNKSVNLACLNCVIDASIFKAYSLLISKSDVLYNKDINFIKKNIKKNMRCFNFQDSLIFDYLENFFYDNYSKFIVNHDKNRDKQWNDKVSVQLPVNNWIVDKDMSSALSRVYREILQCNSNK